MCPHPIYIIEPGTQRIKLQLLFMNSLLLGEQATFLHLLFTSRINIQKKILVLLFALLQPNTLPRGWCSANLFVRVSNITVFRTRDFSENLNLFWQVHSVFINPAEYCMRQCAQWDENTAPDFITCSNFHQLTTCVIKLGLVCVHWIQKRLILLIVDTGKWQPKKRFERIFIKDPLLSSQVMFHAKKKLIFRIW